MLHLSPDAAVTVMGHYPAARCLAGLEESAAASGQRASQGRDRASVHPAAPIPRWCELAPCPCANLPIAPEVKSM